jgi:ParB family chromosome partitioning protein
MTKRQKLEMSIGRNVDESIGATARRAAVKVAESTPARPARPRIKADDAAFRIPLGNLRPDPSQPRKEFDPGKLAELAASLKRRQLQPILVRRSAGDDYTILCGERRFRAAQLAGLPDLLARVDHAGHKPEDVLADQIAENLQREELSPADLAVGLHKLREEHGWNQGKIAERIGISQAQVSRSLALMGLPSTVFDLVAAEQLAPSTALAVAKAHAGDELAIVEAARGVVAGGKSRAEVLADARPAQGPAGLCTVHKTDVADPSTFAEAPAPPREVIAAPARPRAEVAWGWDSPPGATVAGATVIVTAPPGTSPAKIYWLLMEAAAHRNAEEKGTAFTHPIGSEVRVDHAGSPCHGWKGVVTGYNASGDVECDLVQASGKPRAWLGQAKHLRVLSRPKAGRARKAVPR